MKKRTELIWGNLFLFFSLTRNSTIRWITPRHECKPRSRRHYPQVGMRSRTVIFFSLHTFLLPINITKHIWHAPKNTCILDTRYINTLLFSPILLYCYHILLIWITGTCFGFVLKFLFNVLFLIRVRLWYARLIASANVPHWQCFYICSLRWLFTITFVFRLGGASFLLLLLFMLPISCVWFCLFHVSRWRTHT